MAKLNLLLAEFGEQYRLGALTPDEKGIYHIIVDNMEIECFEKFAKGYFRSRLINLSEQTNDLPIVLKDLMNHALIRVKSQGCCLGLENNGDLILFQRFDPRLINLRDFHEILESYSNALEEYQRFVRFEYTESVPTNTIIISP